MIAPLQPPERAAKAAHPTHWRSRNWLWLGALLVLLVAAIPRLIAVREQPAFVDEVYWLLDGHEAFQRWRNRGMDPTGDIWGARILRHPGVPAAIAGGLAESTRDPQADRVDENERILVLARLGIVWTGVLGCLALAVLASKLYGPATGFLAGILLAFSPHHIANSAWLQCDAALTLFTIVSVLTLVLHLRDGGWAWLWASGIAGGLAIASKLPGVVLFPWIVSAYGVARVFGVGGKRPPVVRAAGEVLAWCGAAFATLYLAWPRMWSNPLELVDTFVWAQSLGEGHLNYFRGTITSSPLWTYYLFVVPLSLGEIEWLGLLGCVGWLAVAARRNRFPRTDTVLIILWCGLFLLAMSLSGKKLGARYVLPLWPVLALGIARLAVLAFPLLSKVRWRVPSLVLSTCALVTVFSALATRGSFFEHANRLLGGIAAMDRTTLVVGVAERDAAQAIDALPTATRVLAAGHLLSLQWHARRPLERAFCESPGLVSPPPIGETDHLVVMRYFEQRCPAYAMDVLSRQGWVLVHTISRGNVALARLYRRTT